MYQIQYSGRELAIVMERELIDIFIWYRKYKKIPEISEEITAQTQAFAQKLDISPLEAFPPSFKCTTIISLFFRNLRPLQKIITILPNSKNKPD